MPDQDRDPVEPDDVGSPPGSRAKPKRLCVISSDRLVTGEFLKALQMSLDPDDELEIIPDRRRGGPPTDQASIERRRRPHVDRALELEGFAIVPTRATQPMENSSLKLPRVPAASPIERLFLKDADERKLESILGFRRRRKVRLRLWLILAAPGSVILVLLVLSPAVKTLMSRARPPAPASADRMNAPSTVAPVPPLAETPSPNPEARALPLAGRPESPGAERAREASALPGAVPGPSASMPPPKAVPDPSAIALPPKGLAFPATSPRFAGLPQVELVRNPAAVPEGGGQAYVARLADAAGRALAGAEVSLLVSMADGTLLDIPLDPDPEPGTYRGTVPPGRSAPVDLRIRVVTSDKRVEIPLTP